MEIRFIVPGQPVAKGRPKFARQENFVTTYSPKKTVNYEKMVRIEATKSMRGHEPSLKPIELSLHVCMMIPISWSKKRRCMAAQGLINPTNKPDLDNILKAVGDSLNSICYKDDSQVIRIMVQKSYSENPHVYVVVRELDGESA